MLLPALGAFFKISFSCKLARQQVENGNTGNYAFLVDQLKTQVALNIFYLKFVALRQIFTAAVGH
jgi:hypothetical protein